MNQQTEVIESFSAEETYALGEKIGQEAKPGQVYTPVSYTHLTLPTILLV